MTTILPKPTVTPTSPTTWTIDFGTGATGAMERIKGCIPSDRYDWTVTHADGTVEDGYAFSDRLAFECAWCRTAPAPEPLALNDIERASMSRDVRLADAVSTAKVYRRLLKTRTGLAWSVRVKRGSSRERIVITATAKRRNGPHMTAHDTALLAAVLGRGHVSRQGVSVSPDDREHTLREIVGPKETTTPAAAVG